MSTDQPARIRREEATTLINQIRTGNWTTSEVFAAARLIERLLDVVDTAEQVNSAHHEARELTACLETTGPRFVRVGATWFNPEHVTQVSEDEYTENDCWISSIGADPTHVSDVSPERAVARLTNAPDSAPGRALVDETGQGATGVPGNAHTGAQDAN